MLSERMRNEALRQGDVKGIGYDKDTVEAQVLAWANEVAALEAQVGEPCSICGQQPAVLVDMEEKATYWKCGDCVLEGIDKKMKLEAQVAKLEHFADLVLNGDPTWRNAYEDIVDA